MKQYKVTDPFTGEDAGPNWQGGSFQFDPERIFHWMAKLCSFVKQETFILPSRISPMDSEN